MLKQVSTICVAAAMSLLLTACYEEKSVTLHKPGVYKGKVDPLVSKSKDAEHQENLRKRFVAVQTDR